MDIAAIGQLAAGIGQLASGASGFFGGGSSSGSSAVQQNMMQNWRNDDLANAERNRQMQYEFAKNGIRWRVEDAKAAGIHPLAALGAATTSASPIAIGPAYGVAEDRNYSRGPDIGSSLKDMGQGLGRAVAATQTKVERQLTAFELMRQEQQIRSGDLDIAIKGAQLAKLTQQSQNGPGLPTDVSSARIPGSTGTGVYEAEPPKVLNPDPNHQGYTAGPATPNATWQRAPSGDVYSVPHKDLQMDEFSSPGYVTWMIHNKVLPYISQRYRDAARPSNALLPPGAVAWRLGAPGLGWVPVYRSIPDSDRQPHGSRSGYYSFYN